MSGHVFISYSSVDHAYVERLAAHLAYSGTAVSVDYEIEIGSPFDEAIQQRIATCGAFVVVLTPDSVRSARVEREIAYADERGKTIMPLLLADCEVPNRLTCSHREDVTRARMPSGLFMAQLHRLVTLAPEGQQYDARDWPDPVPIKTGEDFRSALQSTLVRAGTPSYEELARRTGGILSAADVRGALERVYFWESSAEDDWREVSLILTGLGASGALVAKWKLSFDRLLLLDPIMEKRARNPHSLACTFGWTLLGAVILFLVGTAFSQLPVGRPEGFGGGNWFAFGVSVAVVGILLLGLWSMAWDAARAYGSTLLKIAMQVLLVAAFLAGWRVLQQVWAAEAETIGGTVLSWLDRPF